MGEIRDAISTLMDVKAELANAGIYSTKRSISASAMEGTANFSMLIDESIPLDECILFAKAAEKKFASFLLTVLTMDPYLEVSKGETPSAEKYLHQFHQNMRVKDSTKGLHISLADFVKESTDVEYTTMESEAIRVASAIYENVSQSIPQGINARFNYTVEEVTTPDTLNERFRVLPLQEAKKGGRGGNPGFNSSDGDTFVTNNEYNIKHQELHGNVKSLQADDVLNINNNVDANTRFERGAIDARTTIAKGAISTPVDARTTVTVKAPEQKAAQKVTVRDRGGQWKTLTDNDCKKANDLVPTLLHVRVYPVDKYTREELTPIDFIMGVKATLHPFPVEEIARMTVAAMRNENAVFNFIRWTTGEIKFFKDFLFAIDTIKMDAKDAGRDVTGWRPALKKRKLASKSKLHLTKNSIMPNASLVISQSCVDHIKETYGYDLASEMIIKRMMDTYFLLGYVLVNTVTQRASFRYDGIDTPDIYTYDALRRENQNDDKAFKNMMKMLGRSM